MPYPLHNESGLIEGATITRTVTAHFKSPK
jgi:hypothetical protein